MPVATITFSATAPATRTTCESCIRIDVRHWHREGWLSAGQHFTCSWTHSSGQSASINVNTERDAVVLTYQTRDSQATEWKPINQRVPITWTDLHFGGRRPWFICSVYRQGHYCGRRVAVLYSLRDYFACRHCYKLAYESQQEPIRMRGLVKAQKIRTRLGGDVNIFSAFPKKPPGMHWRTYKRLRRAYEIAKDRSLRGVLGRHPSELPQARPSRTADLYTLVNDDWIERTCTTPCQ
jgi:hypothetical protein